MTEVENLRREDSAIRNRQRKSKLQKSGKAILHSPCVLAA